MLQLHNKISTILRRQHFVIALALVLIIIAAEGFLLYRYFYLSLTESKILAELKQEISLETLDLHVYENLVKFFDQKQKNPNINWQEIYDPFSAISSGAPRQ